MNINSDKRGLDIRQSVFAIKKKNLRVSDILYTVNIEPMYAVHTYLCNCIAPLVRVRVIGSAQADLLAPIKREAS